MLEAQDASSLSKHIPSAALHWTGVEMINITSRGMANIANFDQALKTSGLVKNKIKEIKANIGAVINSGSPILKAFG